MAGKRNDDKSMTQDAETAPEVETLAGKFEHLRMAIRSNLRGGLQTHEAQDYALELTKLVDAIEDEVGK